MGKALQLTYLQVAHKNWSLDATSRWWRSGCAKSQKCSCWQENSSEASQKVGSTDVRPFRDQDVGMFEDSPLLAENGVLGTRCLCQGMTLTRQLSVFT